MSIQDINSASASIKLIVESAKEMAELQKDIQAASIQSSEKLLKVNVEQSLENQRTSNLIDFLA